MSRRRAWARLRRASLVAVAASSVAAAAEGQARSGASAGACVAAAEGGQLDRYNGHLRSARAAFVACANEDCPLPVRSDCARWLSEVDASLPTVVIRQTWEDGSDTAAARVWLDGKPIALRRDGLAMPIDPGEHTFRFEREGARPVQSAYVIQEGEKNRLLRVVFTPVAKAQVPEAASSAAGHASIPPLAYVAGGVGVVGVAAFAVLAIRGTNQLEYLRGTCRTACDPSRVDAAREQLLVGDLALGVGLIALGAATWLILTRPSAPSTAARVNVTASSRGGGVSLEARF